MKRMLAHFRDALAYTRGLAPLTLEAYEADLETLLQFVTTVRRRTAWAQVTPEDLVAHLSDLRARGYADTSLLRYAAAYQTFFRWLLDEGHIPFLPTESLAGGKYPKRLPRSVEEVTLCALIEAVDGNEPYDLRDRAVLELLYGCGLRCAELCGLRLHDLDRIAATLRIRGKGRRERVVPYGAPAGAALSRYLTWREGFAMSWRKGREAATLMDPEAPLFLSPNARALNRGHLATIVRRRIRAFLPEGSHATPHTLRHAFATHLLDHEAPLMDIRDLLGHATIATTQIYTHISNARLRETFARCFPRA